MTTGSRLLKACLGFALILMGAVAAGVLWHSYQRAEETRHWTPVEALVISSQVLTERVTPHSPVKFRADVRYRYTFNGRTFTGSRIRRVDGPTSAKENAESLVATHRAGLVETCFVNPSQPDFAILEHSTRAALYSIWFPLLFVAGGAGMVVSALRRGAAA